MRLSRVSAKQDGRLAAVGNEGECSMNHETVLPKNVRQIGEIQQDKKVYLEDYVITFIRRMEKPYSQEALVLCT